MSQLAIVMLPSGAPRLSKPILAESWRRVWPHEDALNLPAESRDGIFVFPFLGSTATVAHYNAPYAWSDLEGPAATAWRWPDATQTLKAHREHVLVGVVDDEPPGIGRAIKLTLLTAAIIGAFPSAIGVFWAAGTTVVAAREFLDSATSMTPDELPLLSWVEFRLFSNTPGAWNLVTTGMKALGLMEVEVIDSRREPAELFEMVHGIADYLTQAGDVLRDGHTIGSSDEDRYLVNHRPSVWQREGLVLRIGL